MSDQRVDTRLGELRPLFLTAYDATDGVAPGERLPREQGADLARDTEDEDVHHEGSDRFGRSVRGRGIRQRPGVLGGRQTKAPMPVAARPTIRVLISRVPS